MVKDGVEKLHATAGNPPENIGFFLPFKTGLNFFEGKMRFRAKTIGAEQSS